MIKVSFNDVINIQCRIINNDDVYRMNIKNFNSCLLIPTILFLFMGSALSKNVYLGTLLGETSVKYVSSDLGLTSADIRYQGFSGRYFIGYSFSDTFSIEGSWLHAHKISVLNINNSKKEGKININSYGVLARFGLQITKVQELFFKFGAVYTRANTDKMIQQFSNEKAYSRDTNSHYRPALELGIVRRFFKYLDFGVAVHYVAEHRTIPSVTLIGFHLSIILDRNMISRSKNNSAVEEFNKLPPPPRNI